MVMAQGLTRRLLGDTELAIPRSDGAAGAIETAVQGLQPLHRFFSAYVDSYDCAAPKTQSKKGYT